MEYTDTEVKEKIAKATNRYKNIYYYVREFQGEYIVEMFTEPVRKVGRTNIYGCGYVNADLNQQSWASIHIGYIPHGVRKFVPAGLAMHLTGYASFRARSRSEIRARVAARYIGKRELMREVKSALKL